MMLLLLFDFVLHMHVIIQVTRGDAIQYSSNFRMAADKKYRNARPIVKQISSTGFSRYIAVVVVGRFIIQFQLRLKEMNGKKINRPLNGAQTQNKSKKKHANAIRLFTFVFFYFITEIITTM